MFAIRLAARGDAEIPQGVSVGVYYQSSFAPVRFTSSAFLRVSTRMSSASCSGVDGAGVYPIAMKRSTISLSCSALTIAAFNR